VAILGGGLAIAYFAWFRDSSLVAVQNVKVEGVRSTEGDQVTAALTDAAKGMTTLDFDASRLASAVSGFPSVASVSADTSFPHGVTVHVTERQAALVVGDGHRRVPVAADGSLLTGLDVDGSTLPVIHMNSVPTAPRLSGDLLQEARALAAAPHPLRPLIENVEMSHDYGVVVTMRQGIDLRFGTASGAASKWAAAAAILADPGVTSAGYVDVRVPQRPAIGG
jgi:cell division protein FtsQ